MSAVTPPECASPPGAGRNVPKRSGPRGEGLYCRCSTGKLAQSNAFGFGGLSQVWLLYGGVAIRCMHCLYVALDKSVLNE